MWNGVMSSVFFFLFSSHCRVVLLVGVDVTTEEEKPEAAVTGEEDACEDVNDNEPLLKWAMWAKRWSAPSSPPSAIFPHINSSLPHSLCFVYSFKLKMRVTNLSISFFACGFVWTYWAKVAHFTQEEKGLLVTCFRCDSSLAVITIEGFFLYLIKLFGYNNDIFFSILTTLS